MSLDSINAYVNEFVSLNRSSDSESISTYFRLMNERAAEMLDQLEASSRLLGLEKLNVSLLNAAEKLVVLEAVNYIIANSSDLAKGLDIIKDSGLLDLQGQAPENRYVLVYKLEPVLRYASELYADNLGWWETLKLRNKKPSFFTDKFEKAATEKTDKETITPAKGQ